MATFEYDADQIAISLGGIKIDSGFTDGTFLTIEQDAEDFTYLVGTDGSVTRSKTKNQVTKVSFILVQSSPINDQLSALRILDLSAKNGAGIAPFLAKDLNGTTLAAAAHCWISKPPKQEFAREAKEREWMLVASDMNLFVGSNPKL